MPTDCYNQNDHSMYCGEFEKISLTDPENPNKKTTLSDGQFNINRKTLNKRDDL